MTQTQFSLYELNLLSDQDAKEALYRCCSSDRWATQLAYARPFKDETMLYERADQIWSTCNEADSLEAFSHHPRIGGNLAALREKFKATETWASQEQKGVSQASEEVLEALSAKNEAYEKKFGFVFLICATGKTAEQMLAALESRLANNREQELQNARTEQGKITLIRLKKLLKEPA